MAALVNPLATSFPHFLGLYQFLQLVDGVEAYLPLAGLFDVEAELARLAGEIDTARTNLDRLNAKLANASFVERAPAAVVEKEREKQRAAGERLEKLESRRREIGSRDYPRFTDD